MDNNSRQMSNGLFNTKTTTIVLYKDDAPKNRAAYRRLRTLSKDIKSKSTGFSMAVISSDNPDEKWFANVIKGQIGIKHIIKDDLWKRSTLDENSKDAMESIELLYEDIDNVVIICPESQARHLAEALELANFRKRSRALRYLN